VNPRTKALAWIDPASVRLLSRCRWSNLELGALAGIMAFIAPGMSLFNRCLLSKTKFTNRHFDPACPYLSHLDLILELRHSHGLILRVFTFRFASAGLCVHCSGRYTSYLAAVGSYFWFSMDGSGKCTFGDLPCVQPRSSPGLSRHCSILFQQK
jgi:hypothetical protein